MVEMKIASVGVVQGTNGTIVVLRESDGPRMLVIGIGLLEASAIAMEMEGIKPPRPMTHDLIRLVFSHAKMELDRIIINDLQDETFFAKLLVDTGNGSIEIDSRPSDAMAIALRMNAPIYCDERVLEEASIMDLDDTVVH